MSTTAIFAEILIIGLQASVWVALLACTFWPDLREGLWRAVTDNEVLLGGFALAAIYTLGILVDRFSDNFGGWLRDRKLLVRLKERREGGSSLLRRREPEDRRETSREEIDALDRQDEITEGASLLPKFPILRLRALGEEGRAAFIEYQRHRVRVARATTFNLGLVLLAGSLFLMRGYNEYPRWPDDWSKAASVFAIATVVLLWASWRAAERIEKAQDKRLADTYGIWREDRALAGAPGAIVSAVCHRRVKDEVQVLLVNTKGGRHWTFPKGHVGPGEDPRSAAAREAREEAGVLGRVHPYPVGIYLYPGSSDAPNHETPVTAYLLEVTKAGPPKEPERRPTWCTPPEARFLLAEGRDERFAREHDHILTTALARLA